MLQNDFLLWQMYFLSLGSVPQLSGAIPQFLGEMPQFLGELPQFSGELLQTQGEGLRTCLEGNETLPLAPRAFASENQVCDYSNKTTKEVSLMCYSSAW